MPSGSGPGTPTLAPTADAMAARAPPLMAANCRCRSEAQGIGRGTREGNDEASGGGSFDALLVEGLVWLDARVSISPPPSLCVSPYDIIDIIIRLFPHCDPAFSISPV